MVITIKINYVRAFVGKQEALRNLCVRMFLGLNSMMINKKKTEANKGTIL